MKRCARLSDWGAGYGRNGAVIRIDDFALTAGVSKQFMTDLENGKPTVRMGMVLTMLQRLGVRVSLDLPDDALTIYEVEFDKVTADVP